MIEQEVTALEFTTERSEVDSLGLNLCLEVLDPGLEVSQAAIDAIESRAHFLTEFSGLFAELVAELGGLVAICTDLDSNHVEKM